MHGKSNALFPIMQYICGKFSFSCLNLMMDNMLKIPSFRSFLLLSSLLFFTGNVSAQDNDRAFETAKNISIFNSVLKELNTLYVDTFDLDKMVEKGINTHALHARPVHDLHSPKPRPRILNPDHRRIRRHRFAHYLPRQFYLHRRALRGIARTTQRTESRR